MKQRQHVRTRKTRSGVKRFVVNRGNLKKLSKRCSKKKKDEGYLGDDVVWDLEGYDSPGNVKRWKKFYKDKEKVPSVKDIMGKENDEEED